MPRAPQSWVRLDVDVGREPDAPAPLREPAPFRIAILGDFRGAAGRVGAAVPLESRSPVPVDRDNVDDVMAQWRPALRLALPDGSPELLQIGELDDFHADRLYARLPVFARLRELRKALAETAPRAGAARGTPPPGRTPLTAELLAAPGSLLDEIVGGAPAGAEDLSAFVRRVVAPYVVPELAPEQAALVARLDALRDLILRAVLHDPAVQALESLWRSLRLMVRRVETSADLQIHLVDVSREELAADLADAEPAAGRVSRMLTSVGGAEDGATPWALLVGVYTFGAAAGDIPLLGRIAALARTVGAPWISAAHPWLVGCSGATQLANPESWRQESAGAWSALRGRAEARWLGLIMPRFLGRLPYGAGGERCETFAFEELHDPIDHEHLLWTNGAMAGAVLLAQGFADAGWDLRPGLPAELDRLPLYVRHDHGEAVATPCAEALLTETAVERLLEAGIMPLVCRRNGDTVRLVRFQSVADPLAPLAGRWAGGSV
jgi:type VI secretion system protein ImpC